MRGWVILISALLVTGCTSSNVSRHWDCPAQSGYGCVDMERADEQAIQNLKERTVKQRLKRKTKIWFAPFIREVEK